MEDQKINMALDDIIKLERMKMENGNESMSHKSHLGFRANGARKIYMPRNQNAAGDPNSIQNLHYSYRGPLANRNRKRYGVFRQSPLRRVPAAQYWRNRVRYATQYLNRTQQAQRQMLQKPFSKAFLGNRLLALKSLQKLRTLRNLKMNLAARARRDSDSLSVVIPNDIAVRRHAALRGRRHSSQLTVRNMQKFDALAEGIMRSCNGSAYSPDYRSRQSLSASVGRHSRAGTPTRHYAGSLGGRNSRAGTPANSEASGYSVKNHHNRLLNYKTQRQIAILQGRTVPVDLSGRPTIFSNGFGMDFEVTPVSTSQTLHERISIMLQNL